MKTKKLYYENVYMKEFTARVVSCEGEGLEWKIVLDQTAFYPEGGGQPADHGTLVLMDEAAQVCAAPGKAQAALCASCFSGVKDVHEKDGMIVHTCDRPMEPGSLVCGRIDWKRRFDHMQQHSGEHIVSGMICSRFHGNNVGFHMSPDVVTIDFDVAMTWIEAMEIENAANAYIAEDHPLEILWPSEQELAELEYRSKKELHGDVRIVNFAGADICACCGTHVTSSAQVNMVKLISCQKHKNGTRLELLAGQRALRYLSGAWQQNLDISRQLSAKPMETAAAVERLRGELQRSQERTSRLLEGVFDRIAEEHSGAGDTLIIYEELTPDDTRKLCDRVAGVCGGLCAVFAGSGEHYNYAIISAAPDETADTREQGMTGNGTAPQNGQAQSRSEMVRALVKDLNAALNGRGGGRDGWAQGSVNTDEARIREFFTLKALPSGQTDSVLARMDGWTFGNQDGMSK